MKTTKLPSKSCFSNEIMRTILFKTQLGFQIQTDFLCDDLEEASEDAERLYQINTIKWILIN